MLMCATSIWPAIACQDTAVGICETSTLYDSALQDQVDLAMLPVDVLVDVCDVVRVVVADVVLDVVWVLVRVDVAENVGVDVKELVAVVV